ncbi:GL23539 [Drosophila persimilis]|uniref:GL23539 n=1 Tax=Drosophila persimilis TaxID=7234 RepID=B4G2V8_DROPE|nr:GL23539 [Drosophila persimilis]
MPRGGQEAILSALRLPLPLPLPLPLCNWVTSMRKSSELLHAKYMRHPGEQEERRTGGQADRIGWQANAMQSNSYFVKRQLPATATEEAAATSERIPTAFRLGASIATGITDTPAPPFNGLPAPRTPYPNQFGQICVA